MKTFRNIATILVILMISGNATKASSFFEEEKEKTDTIKYSTYTGIIKDAQNNDPLPFATIESIGLNIATVTNIDGEFTLKIPERYTLNEIKVSYIGYDNAVEKADQFKNSNQKEVLLEPRSSNIKEVTIRVEDASTLIDEILANIKKNYSTEDMMMQAFYRETIKKRRRYVSISEAVVDIYKPGYNNDFKYDQVKLLHGRKSANVDKMDTILFKLQGGPATTLLLDIVKNPYLLLSREYKKVYTFNITGVVSMNDRLHYVISFEQKPHVTIPFYFGKLYVDMDNLAITEAEFELNMENELAVSNMFIRKKPIGISVDPERAYYRSKYTIEDDKWYFSYARGEAKFDVKWDRKLFKTNYSTMSEIAITKRSNEAVDRIPNRERFKKSQILDELVYVFFDQDFWRGYNVIEPDQSIETAIKRLNRKFVRSDE